MEKELRDQAVQLAWETLLDCGVSQLPVSISDLCRSLGAQLHLYKPRDQNDGLCFIADGTAHILVSGRASRPRQRFTAAHELGHLLLGHVESAKAGSPSAELQADLFAAELLAPSCVLWGCGCQSARDITCLCAISRVAALRRQKALLEQWRQSCPVTDPLERMLYYQFIDFIRRTRPSLTGGLYKSPAVR